MEFIAISSPNAEVLLYGALRGEGGVSPIYTSEMERIDTKTYVGFQKRSISGFNYMCNFYSSGWFNMFNPVEKYAQSSNWIMKPQLPWQKKHENLWNHHLPPVVGKLIRFSSFRGSGPFLVGPPSTSRKVVCDHFVRGTAVATRCWACACIAGLG